MNCRSFEESIGAYLDGSLARPEAAEFSAHALACRSCRTLLDDVKAVLDSSADLEPSPALDSALINIHADYGPFDCDSFEELVTEFLDGFLQAPQYHRFEEHAAQCERCSSVLTGVVYAVAACHMTHTYEEVDVPAGLEQRLFDLAAPSATRRRSIPQRISQLAARLIPSAAQAKDWSLATASLLVLVTLSVLLLQISDDRSVTGIYRSAHARAVELYSHGGGIVAQGENVVARLERVGTSLNEIWSHLGRDGSSRQEGDKSQKPAAGDKEH